ncbi:hypothetical protein L6R53_25430 [Myxococcota bacterium]|nr:hypothetical protein [Myxococcota bacterium]
MGPSGSGKTSLALDTVHAAARARLAAALGHPPLSGAGPRVSELDGLPLTLAVSDRSPPPAGARVLDLLGLTPDLVAVAMAAGVQRCPACARPLPVTTADAITAELLRRAEGRRLTLLAPVARGRLGGLGPLVEEVGRQGFARVRIDGQLHRVEEAPAVDARLPHDLDVVVDRLRPDAQAADRLAEAVGTTLVAGQGRVVALVDEQEHSFSERPWCPDHPHVELEPVRAEWLAGGAGARCRACEGTAAVQGAACPACGGTGLRDEVAHRAVGAAGHPWPSLVDAPLACLPERLGELPGPACPAGARVRRWVELAVSAGLGHLPGSRRARELASGELRRLRVLTTWERARLIPGALLVLDEPLAGLDPVAERAMVALLASGEVPTLAVTHSPALVSCADHVVAFGPGAGRRGGRVTWQGGGSSLPAELLPCPPPAPLPPPPPDDLPGLTLRGATGHVLGLRGGVDARFPRGRLTVVTGPSGSGKTTLLVGTLIPALRARMGLSTEAALPHRGLDGVEGLSQLLTFERTGATPGATSCVATLLGAWAPLRELLSQTREARILGFDAARFRFDRPGGRCEACQGAGLRRVEVLAGGSLADDAQDEPCPVCEGHRFQRDTLRVRLKGRTVAELLETEVHEASVLFAAHKVLAPPLLAARQVGLGYLPLGQPAATLSGGEGQRLRLAQELARTGAPGGGEARRLDDRVVVLDAPTVGLHPDDQGPLVEALRRMAERGATVIVGTVSPALLAAADHAIVLPGP